MVFFGLEDEEYDRKYKDSVLLKRIFPYLAKYKRSMILVIIFLTLTSITSGLIPYITSSILNNIGSTNDLKGLILFIIILFVLNFLGFIFNWVSSVYSARIIGNVVLNLQTDVYKSVLNQNLSFFDKYPVGKIASRVNTDTQNFGEMSTLVMEMVSSFMVVIIVFIPMFIISPILSVLLLAMVPFVFLIALSFRKRARKKTLMGQRALSVVNAFVQETMTGIQIAKTFRQEDKLYKQFNKVNNQSYRVNLSRALLLNMIFPFLNFIQGAAMGILMYYGGSAILNTGFSPGDLYLFIQSLWLIFYPLFSIAAFWPQFQSGMSAAERIFALMDAPLSIIQNNSEEISIKNGEIEIKDLTFGYLSENNVFEHLSLKVKPGESLAIVGHTGAGKSTLAKLLGRFYEFQSGEIRIDGKNIRDLDLKSYRSQIGFIPQTPFLWADTLENNVKYGKLSATREEVIWALDQAGGSDWVDDLPQGLETNVNERGKVLSMGQRQLVSFARILLSNPKILILDEATASVDPFTETRIQDALEKTMQGRTSIIIAHRLWTVRKVDRIIVIDKGKIVEEGNHEELMKQGGHYANLYNTYFKHQSFKFIEEIGKIA